MDILELIKLYTEYIKVMHYQRLLGFFCCIQIVLHFQVYASKSKNPSSEAKYIEQVLGEMNFWRITDLMLLFRTR